MKRFVTRLKYSILGLLFANSSIIVTFLRMYIIYKQNRKEDVRIEQIIFSTFSINKVLLDFYIYYSFAVLFNYFWYTKQQKLRESMQLGNKREISNLEYFVLTIIGLIYILCILNTCLIIFQIVSQYIFLNEFKNSWAADVLVFCLKYIIPFKDMLIALSFTWLYYHQGMKKNRKDQQEREVDPDIQDIINDTQK